MAEEVTNVETVKTASDGMVKITIEKYNELVQTASDQRSSIARLTEQLNKARNEPPVINRTIVQKTAEMAAQDNRGWGITFMGVGAAFFAVGAFRYKAGRTP